MNERLREDTPQKARDWPTENPRANPGHANRNPSAKRQPVCCSLTDRQTETSRDRQSGWFPLSLAALVLLCLIMAAWVWFEILWMSP